MVPSSAKPAMVSVSRWAQVFFTPFVAARVCAVADFRLEAFAELDVSAGDDLLELRLSLVERTFPQVAAIQL